MTTGWPVVPLWSITRELRSTIDPADLSGEVFHYSIPVVDETGTGRVEEAADSASQKLLLDGGEVLISKLNPRKGRILIPGPSPLPIMASPEFIALIVSDVILDRFLAHLLASESSRQYLDSRVQSVTRSHQRVTPELIRHMSIALPSIDEQRRIADFLDIEVARIAEMDDLRKAQESSILERKRRCIELLFQRASATQMRVKHLLRSKPRYGVLVPEFVDGGVPLVRVNDLLGLGAKVDQLRTIPSSLSRQYSTTVVGPGDILVSVVGTLGRSVVVPRQLVGANVNRAIAVLRARKDVAPELLSAWMGTGMFETQAMLATGNDSAQRTLGMEDLANFKISWPADVREQSAAIARLTQLEIDFNDLLTALNRQRVLLVERRQALITAAVAGQIDVTTARGVDV